MAELFGFELPSGDDIFNGAVDWAKDTVGDKLKGKANEILVDNPWMEKAGAAAGAYALQSSGLMDPQITKAGYQGTVPNMKAVMARVPYLQDPNQDKSRAFGRRYFSDVRYVTDPDKASGIASTPRELYGATRKTQAEQEAIKANDPTAKFNNQGYRVNADGGIMQDADPTQELRRYLGQTIDEGRGSLTADQQAAYRRGPQILGDVVPQTIMVRREDADGLPVLDQDINSPTYGEQLYDTVPNPEYGDGTVASGIDSTSGRKILDADRYILNPASLYDDEGYFNPGLGPEEADYRNAQFDSAGYLITRPEERTAGAMYTDEGYQISSPEVEYTREYVAQQQANAEAAGLAALNYANPYGGRNFTGSPYAEPDTSTVQGNARGGVIGLAGGGRPTPYDSTNEEEEKDTQPPMFFGKAQGGITQLAGGRYLDGMSDGMADEVPANIDGVQPAALSDGEFVIPADVVSHLGNGSSNAGAKVLDDMMSNVRKTRTGNSEQGKQINPQRVMAKSGLAGYANGGPIRKFNAGDMVKLDEPIYMETGDGNTENANSTVNTEQQQTNSNANVDSTYAEGSQDTFGAVNLGTKTGEESSLSNWVGDFVTQDILGEARGLDERGYQAYYDELAAGSSELQDQVFDAAGRIDTTGSQLGSFGDLTAEQRAAYMDPYLEATMEPELRAAKERADRERMENAARMTQSGSFGGSRQAILDSLNRRDLLTSQSDIENRARSQAFASAADRFGEDRRFGLDALQTQSDLGGIQRGIDADLIAARKEQFEEERDFPYKNISWKASLLQDLPLEAQNYSYAEPAKMAQLMSMYDTLLGGAEGESWYDKITAATAPDEPAEPASLDVYGTTYTYNDKPEGVDVATWTAAIDSGNPDEVADLLE